ncbi:hypothetical protein E2C01_076336 [Portunus trituberculatus]|uniref:Uncharacterized protein n=1 Tax=Portunus trituberculatus TaxID=210409 RepID=A0A5B7INA8_PORTR|nr:hypothetical protein [Portunus trituberculatus]
MKLSPRKVEIQKQVRLCGSFVVRSAINGWWSWWWLEQEKEKEEEEEEEEEEENEVEKEEED